MDCMLANLTYFRTVGQGHVIISRFEIKTMRLLQLYTLFWSSSSLSRLFPVPFSSIPTSREPVTHLNLKVEFGGLYFMDFQLWINDITQCLKVIQIGSRSENQKFRKFRKTVILKWDIFDHSGQNHNEKVSFFIPLSFFFLPFYVENENLLISQRVSHFDKAKSCTCRMWNKSHRVAELSDSYYSPSRTAFFLRGLLLFKNSSSTTRDQRKEWIRKNSEWPAAPKNAKRWGRARQE